MAIHLHPDRDPSGATSGLTGLTIATANEILGYLTGVTDLPARDPNSSTGASLPVPSPQDRLDALYWADPTTGHRNVWDPSMPIGAAGVLRPAPAASQAVPRETRTSGPNAITSTLGISLRGYIDLSRGPIIPPSGTTGLLISSNTS